MLSDFHIWALPVGSSKEPEESIGFTELENDLGNGFYAQVLYGSNNGLRRWRLKLPTLADVSVLPNTVVGISGAAVSREEYLWELFCETKVTGTPFAYQSQRNGQYYLVRFADKELTYQKMKVKLYSTGIELKQVRVDGQTVWSPAATSLWAAYDGADFPGPFGQAWPDSTGNINSLETIDGGGDVIAVASMQNGEPGVRFNSVTNDSFLSSSLTLELKEVILVMKMREATFSNFGGILSDNNTGVALLGDSGTTKFFDLGFGDLLYEYRLNGTRYLSNNQQAPMNAFGIVHLRHTSGIPIINLQMGKDRNFAGRYAELDICSAFLSDTLQPKMVIREMYEALSVKYAIAANYAD